MTIGRSIFLVDTNVLVYALDPRFPEKQRRAKAVLERLVALEAGAISTQVLGEFYNALTRNLKPAFSPSEAGQNAGMLANFWRVLEIAPLPRFEV